MPLQIEWEKLLDEVQRHFIALLKIDTTNPPGNEAAAARYIRELFDREGIPSETVESAPGRANLVARLGGKQRDNGLLMTSHLDVVPVDRAQWRCDPFAGEIHDGEIYGRGTIDMKNMTAYAIAAMLTAKRLGWDLKRDLVMSAFADEEAGCVYGSRYMVEKRPDLLAARYAFNEVGGFTLYAGAQRIYPIQVAEKGFIWLRMKVAGDPGHGSMPHNNNAVVKLARAVARLGAIATPLHVDPVVNEFLDVMGEYSGGLPKLFLKLARNPIATNLVTRRIMPLKDKDQARAIYASLRNTVNPTGLLAGKKINVIPSEAEALLDCRVLPGVGYDQLIGEITRIVGKGFTFELIESGAAGAQNWRGPMYDLLKRVLEEADPGSKAVPYLLTGFSDNIALTKLGLTCYGYAPFKLAPNVKFISLYHGHNERIGVEAFRWGVKTFLEAVYRYAVQGEA